MIRLLAFMFTGILTILSSQGAFAQYVDGDSSAKGCTVAFPEGSTTKEFYVQVLRIIDVRTVQILIHPFLDRNARCPKARMIFAQDANTLREHLGRVLKVRLGVSEADFHAQNPDAILKLVSYSVATNAEIRKFGFLVLDADVNKEGSVVFDDKVFTDRVIKFMPITGFESALERSLIDFSPDGYLDSVDANFAVGSTLHYEAGDRIRFIAPVNEVEDAQYIQEEWEKIKTTPWKYSQYHSIFGRGYVNVMNSSVWLVKRN